MKTEQGGLIALTVEECDLLLEWYVDHLAGVMHAHGTGMRCDELADRLRIWRSRHVA